MTMLASVLVALDVVALVVVASFALTLVVVALVVIALVVVALVVVASVVVALVVVSLVVIALAVVASVAFIHLFFMFQLNLHFIFFISMEEFCEPDLIFIFGKTIVMVSGGITYHRVFIIVMFTHVGSVASGLRLIQFCI